MAHSGFQFDQEAAAELELAYIGGLLKLDQVVDQEAQAKAFELLEQKARRGPSPERRG